MISNLEELNVTQLAADALAEHTGNYIRLNKEQLMEGKNRLGEDLSPTYLEDPYFKTPESALRYSKWKDEITPNPKRKKHVPNLFIIGSFQGSIEMDVVKDEFELRATYKDAPSIEAKFTNDIYGLNEEKSGKLIEEGLEDSFYNKSRQQLGIENT